MKTAVDKVGRAFFGWLLQQSVLTPGITASYNFQAGIGLISNNWPAINAMGTKVKTGVQYRY